MLNAYFAPPATMVGAVLLASANKDDVMSSPELQTAFVAFTQALSHAHAKRTLGLNIVDFGEPSAAPEHERGGHA
ncbi:MAG: hypothetical protein ACK44A_05415 [Roseateles sp.]